MAPTAKPPAVCPVEREAEHDEQHDADDGDRRVLAIEVGRGACLDGRGDFLHARVAGGLLDDPADREHAVQHGEHAGADREPKRDISGHESSP